MKIKLNKNVASFVKHCCEDLEESPSNFVNASLGTYYHLMCLSKEHAEEIGELIIKYYLEDTNEN